MSQVQVITIKPCWVEGLLQIPFGTFKELPVNLINIYKGLPSYLIKLPIVF